MTSQTSAAWHRYPQTMTPPLTASLWAAAKANDASLLATLLDQGCSINERDERGYAPLMLAAYAGNLEALDFLLSRGADPNTADLFGNTALMGAAFKGYVPIVLRLLSAGADPNTMNHGGLDARGFALTFGRTDVFSVLDRIASHA